MRGPRKIDGTLQINPENVRVIRCYMIGTGSAKQAVAIDFDTTTNGLYHAEAADSDTAGHKATVAGVALEAWDCDADNDGTDDTEQVIKIQVLGPVTNVPVDASVAISDKLIAGSTAGQLARVADVAWITASSGGNPTDNELRDMVDDALNRTVVGIAVTARDGDGNATVYLLNPLGL